MLSCAAFLSGLRQVNGLDPSIPLHKHKGGGSPGFGGGFFLPSANPLFHIPHCLGWQLLGTQVEILVSASKRELRLSKSSGAAFQWLQRLQMEWGRRTLESLRAMFGIPFTVLWVLPFDLDCYGWFD